VLPLKPPVAGFNGSATRGSRKAQHEQLVLSRPITNLLLSRIIELHSIYAMLALYKLME
jgi:hypothetical protein